MAPGRAARMTSFWDRGEAAAAAVGGAARFALATAWSMALMIAEANASRSGALPSEVIGMKAVSTFSRIRSGRRPAGNLRAKLPALTVISPLAVQASGMEVIGV